MTKYLNEDLVFIVELMNDRSRRLAAYALSMVLLGAALTILIPYGISMSVQGITDKSLQLLVIGGAVFVGLEITAIIFGWVRQHVRERFFQEAFWVVPQDIIRRYYERPLGMLTSKNSGIDGGGVESLRQKVRSIIHGYIFSIIPGYGLAIFGLMVCFVAHPAIGTAATLYAIADLKVGAYVNARVQKMKIPIIDDFKKWDRRMIEWTHSVDHVKSHGVETKILQQVEGEIQDALKADDYVWRVYFNRLLIFRRLGRLVFAGILYSATIYLSFQNQISITGTVMILFSFERVRGELGSIIDQQREVQFHLAGIGKYRRVLKEPVAFLYNEGEAFVGDTIGVKYEKVSLTVPEETGERLILRDISFSVAPGERVGVVGPSGAGKSQLMKLLVRAIDPDKGRVCINQYDLRELSSETYLRYVGVIMQKSEPFEDTVLGNLMFGVSHLEQLETASQSDLENRGWEALKKAGLDFGNELTNGLYTNIGYKGLRLSGGQQQRLQIAAAHFKMAYHESERPRLIIADEPTASLDSMSELTVMRHLNESLPTGTTMLMVAHRLSTVANLDRIIFVRPLEECPIGVKQVTTHESLSELYDADALFRQMADAQGFVPREYDRLRT